ncbi:MAG: DNA polymerase/3'-5' exonuclease PolX [Candidatus Marsarchaeota archaeon]|nr:DNA polymerase/3'-5' exonuclease PolX [Candidatus Marsarchaeota archaeon]MCL5413442.1 DNA polymerase/3'-5' exonuclease PolX [Candidatus Marsarchaeota archaeon]
MYNSQVAGLFDEIADMLSLDERKDRKFEVLAYRKAAMTISSLQEDVGDIYRKKGMYGLMELPGVGKGISGAIREFIETGRMRKYEDLKKRYPIDFKNLTRIRGLGSKRAFRLYKELRIKSIDDLKRALAKHRIKELPGFGAKSESELSKGMETLELSRNRMALGLALPEAELLVNRLKGSGLVDRVAIAGSTRRMKETVGDLDILVTSSHNEKVMDFISRLNEVQGVTLKGPTKITVRLKIGLSCDVRVVDDASFGAALQYFTGNKDHNVKVRQIAVKKGYKLNEYGLFDRKNRNLAGPDEESVYKKLGMDIMDPEMREDRGEVELSLQHRLPRLVSLGDIRGDLHVHTNHSDGANTIIEMAEAAKKIGREYIGITDHTKSEYVAGGMDDKKFVKHLHEIDYANDKLDGIRILKSAEIDILKDGSLDLQDKTLDMMDYRLASIHTNLNMQKEEMTRRVVKAMESGYVDILAHPTDRIINVRNPINMDLDRVFQAAADSKVVLEIDGYPERLDLNDENIIKARGYKAKFSIDTDSHRDSHYMLMKYGISTAKRGWVTPDLVVNALPLDKLMKQFRK